MRSTPHRQKWRYPCRVVENIKEGLSIDAQFMYVGSGPVPFKGYCKNNVIIVERNAQTSWTEGVVMI